MHCVIAVAIAAVVGAGLGYGFRGWISRTKNKLGAEAKSKL